MGLSLSTKSNNYNKAISEKEQQINIQIEDWIVLRNNTIKELLRVADELDALHKKTTYSRLLGGVASAVGGGIFVTGVGLSLFTGGTSLLLTGAGLSIAAGGGITATVAEVVEYVKKKTRVDSAQKALEADKAAQVALLSKIEKTIEASDIEAEEKKRVKSGLKGFVEGLQKLWVSGVKIYGWAKSGQAIYSTVKWAQTGSSIWKFGATQGLKRTLMSVGGGLAGSIFIIVDLSYVIHHAMEIRKGSPSDAAKSIRAVCRILREERDKIIAMTRSH